MRLTSLLFAAFLLLSGCATKTASIDPAQDIDAGVCNWAFTGSADFEATSKGQGSAKSYKCHLGSATIYRYTAGRSDWTDSKDDLQTMIKLNHSGIVQGYKNNGITSEPFILYDQNGRNYLINGKNVAAMRYDLRDAKGNKSISFLFLTADAGEILKYRITFGDYNKDFLTSVSLSLLRQSVPKTATSAN